MVAFLLRSRTESELVRLATEFMFGLPTQRDRQHVLREYNPTNYSVVNVNTIDSVGTAHITVLRLDA